MYLAPDFRSHNVVCEKYEAMKPKRKFQHTSTYQRMIDEYSAAKKFIVPMLVYGQHTVYRETPVHKVEDTVISVKRCSCWKPGQPSRFL